MPVRPLAARLLPLLLLLPLGCIPTSAISLGPDARVSTDLIPVLGAVEDVFEREGLPVSSVDEAAGELTSGPFTVRYTWAGDRVAERLECPVLGDLGPSTLYDAAFEVMVVARTRHAGTSTDHLTLRGAAIRAGEDAESVGPIRCHLREPFRQWLIEEVRRKALNLPMGPRTY